MSYANGRTSPALCHVRRRPHQVVLAALLLLVCAVLPGAALAPSAFAEQPLRVPERVTDSAGVLTPEQSDRVADAVNDLYEARQVRLWVVFVDTFSGLDPQEWAERTADLSGFGDNDALLAVAVGDRAYDLSITDAMSAISSDEERSIRVEIERVLATDNWAGAAITAAGSLDTALAPTHVSPIVIAVLFALVVAAVGGLVLWSRRRRQRKDAADAAALLQVDLTDPNAVGQFPITALEEQSKKLLVETDNDLRTSVEELQRAREEFGEADAAPFVQAVQNAQAALAQAFHIRQRLDDAIPESQQQRHTMLVEIIVTCARADRFLDEQAAVFARKRDVLFHAHERFATLTQEVVALQVRVPQSRRTLDELGAQFPESALTAVAGNVDLAEQQLVFADKAIADGRVALRKGDGQPVVTAVRSAEGAVQQAGALLDGVDRAQVDITAAIATLPAAMADARAGIDKARGLIEFGGEALDRARALAEQALGRAEASQQSDPLSSLRHLADADAKLDTLLGTAEQAQAQAEHACQTLAHDLSAAQAGITAAGDFIATRRGAVGAEPRTRLAEAERNFALAQQLAATDAPAAVQHARTAAALAGQALQYAQGEVRQWSSQQQAAYRRSGNAGSGGRGGSDIGAVLGGILIGTMTNSGRSRNWGVSRQPRGGGGFSAGSFGGSQSRGGRRGGGGRF